MAQYLLSVHSVEDPQIDVPQPMSPEEMHQMYAQVGSLEADLKSAGAWVFGGRLHAPDTATVVRVSNNGVLTTDGPFAESKEHLGGFYIIEAADLDAALDWASRVSRCIHAPIEVRPFFNDAEGDAAWKEAEGATA